MNHETTDGRVALVVNDPHMDTLDRDGRGWPFFGEQLQAHDVVDNLVRLVEAAKGAGVPVFVSPHHYYPHDDHWTNRGPAQQALHDAGVLRMDALEQGATAAGTGADVPERLRALLLDGETVFATPHKIYGPDTGDLVMQLRQRRIDTVVLAGPGANLCNEGHMRGLIEHGFRVYVVKDATATTSPEAYQAALISYESIANGSWTTAEAVTYLAAEPATASNPSAS